MRRHQLKSSGRPLSEYGCRLLNVPGRRASPRRPSARPDWRRESVECPPRTSAHRSTRSRDWGRRSPGLRAPWPRSGSTERRWRPRRRGGGRPRRNEGASPFVTLAETAETSASYYNIELLRVTTCPLPIIRPPPSAGLCASWALICTMRGAGVGCRCRSSRTGPSRPGRHCSGSVIHALGLLDGLGDVADWRRDEFGHTLMTAELPRRARSRRPARSRSDD